MAGGRAMAVGSRESRWFAALVPRGWPDFFVQVALLGSFEFFYALSGIYGRGEAGRAIENPHGLVRLERTLGLSWEHGLQRWALRQTHLLVEIANRAYFISQFTISTIFLLWVYARRHEQFARVRNALLAANCVCANCERIGCTPIVRGSVAHHHRGGTHGWA